ncbi:MAG: universal stress protein [Archangium sp.]|nr:universal stress protein [Archangium sp.]MDP3571314.1 universal stress protein [Archangium sp.]
MNQLTSTMTMTPSALPLQGLPRTSQVASRPVVLVRAKHETRASGEWAEALAAALQAQLVTLELEALGNQGLDETDRLAQALRSLAPRLVVLPSVVGGPAESAGRLAAACGAPCLVARSRHAHRGVLAATSLEDRRHPVLEEAARVAGALGCPLTFLHNTRVRVMGPHRDTRAASLERRLDQLATELGADVVLTCAFDPVSAILAEAGREDADLIVVGAATSPPDSGPVGGRVAGLATRSVLVVPPAA